MSLGPLVVGVDRSDESAAALEYALGLAATMGTSVVVVHAVGLLEEAGVRPGPSVDELIARARPDDGTAETVAVEVLREDGPAPDVLVRVADRVAASMIVVGRRGLGGAPRPLGSVSEAVLAHADQPVLVVAVRSDEPASVPT